MSYAHEIFGIKETRQNIWMQDLLLAGTTSATFNSDRMLEIASSPFVKDDGWAGYYLILWCKRNGISPKDVLQVGQKVAIRNSDYGTVDNYILWNVDTAACSFVSQGYVNYLPILGTDATYYDGVLGNTIQGTWLRAETPNWYDSSKLGNAVYSRINEHYGYAHGIDKEFKDVLAANTTYNKTFVPMVAVNPLETFKRFTSLGVTFTASPTAIYMKDVGESADTSISYSQKYWMVMVPTASTQGNTIPLAGAVYHSGGSVASLADVNAGTFNSSAQTISNALLTNMTTNETSVYASALPSMRTKTGLLSCFYVEN